MKFSLCSRLFGLCLLATGLWSCEGATYVNHHFVNSTGVPLTLGIRSDASQTGWAMDTSWLLAPGETRIHYAVDQWGKCHACDAYFVPGYGLDSIWATGDGPDMGTLTVNLLDSAYWEISSEEGLSWIRIEQTLSLSKDFFD